MRKIISLLLIFCAFAQVSFAKQWIVFYADLGQIDHPLQNDPSKGGHAFISFIKEDPIKKQTLVDCWGFNPKNPDEIGWISYVEGDIKNDISRQREVGFMIEVTEAELQACTKTKDLWVNSKYSVTMRNCVDFERDIVNTLNENRASGKPRLKQPVGLYVFPSEYVQTLKTLNTALEYKYPIGEAQTPLSSSTLDANFIWKTCFPNNLSFDNIGQLIISTSGNTSKKTELFKIYNYTTNNLKKAFVILYTNDYTNGKKEDCHACYPKSSIARYVYKDKMWSLDKFIDDFDNPSGGWGKGPDITFIIKNGKYYMKAHFSDMHFGEISEGNTYYNLDTFEAEMSD